MSFAPLPRARFRLSRSVLYAIGHVPASIEAAAASDADVVLFELEDAVPVDQKEQARSNVIAALGDLDWTNKSVTVRVNALDSPFTYLDVIALLEAPSSAVIDSLFLPKAGTGADVYAFDTLVTQVERNNGRAEPLGFDIMIESTMGLLNAAAIASASARTESLQFGASDYANSARMLTQVVGGPHPDYSIPGDRGDAQMSDPFHAPISQLVAAARASGVRPIDGPYLDLADLDTQTDGFMSSARRGRVLGCDGKQVMTSRQAKLANDAFSPTGDEIERARELVDAAQHVGADGVVVHQGRYIDQATLHAAHDTLARADAIAQRER